MGNQSLAFVCYFQTGVLRKSGFFDRQNHPKPLCFVQPRQKPRANHIFPQCSSSGTTSSATKLLEALEETDRGLDIDPDAPLSEEEERIEDIIEDIESQNQCTSPTTDERLPGAWELVYTSSSLTRFSGGVTGLQKLLPEGSVGPIFQYIDPEDGSSKFRETLFYEVPLLGNKLETDAVATGRLRSVSETRQTWTPDNVSLFFFKFFADSWKTLRAFAVTDTTYLDDKMRITRGQTGSVNVFVKVEEE